MRYRALHRIYAALNGYFWLPCPVCGEMFGGHEWKDYDGNTSVIHHPDAEDALAICPACTRSGCGNSDNIVIWRS